MSDNNKLEEKSNEIFNDSVRWLLYSGIRIKKAPTAELSMVGKTYTRPLYPFIYSEITDYAITSVCIFTRNCQKTKPCMLPRIL
jgi:hypothetical protein